MSGKNPHRTKGNVKPSSSSRAADFLHQERQTGFIGFSGLSGNTYGYVPQVKGDENELDGDLRMLLRKMTKRDTTTKLKAIQEFTILCKEKDSEIINKVIAFWPRIYNKLAHDFDHRVREAIQQAHHQIVSKAGRNLAPHLKYVIVNWLISQFDTFAPAASAAKISFDEVFQEKKKKEVLMFCKKEIFETINFNIINETADTLSDPKVVPTEEREAKFIRFISSSFLVMKYMLEMISEALTDSEDTIKIFVEKKFWKFAKHKSPLIRSAFYELISSSCMYMPLKLENCLPNLAPAIILNIDEQEPVAVKPLWNVVLQCLNTFELFWDHVNSRKAVIPKLLKLLKGNGYGNIKVVYQNLLPLLSKMSPKAIGDGIDFYREFFNSFTDGLRLNQDVVTISDVKLIISSYWECFQYLIVSKQDYTDLKDYLIFQQLVSMLHEVLHPSDQRYIWFGTFFIDFKKFLSFVNNQALLDLSYFKSLQKDLWDVIDKEIINGSQFTSTQKEFNDSLIDFMFCLCKSDDPTTYSHNGYISQFVQKILWCYITEIYKQQNQSVLEHYLDLIVFVLHKDPLIIRYIVSKLAETAPNEYLTNMEIIFKFCKIALYPFLIEDNSHHDELIIKLMVELFSLLIDDSDKQKFIVFIFENTASTQCKRLLLLTELFKYKEDSFMKKCLVSEFIQSKLLSLSLKAENSVGDGSTDMFVLKWKIYETYLSVLKDSSAENDEFKNSLLEVMKVYLSGKRTQPCDAGIILCFIKLCETYHNISSSFIEVSKVIFEMFATNENMMEETDIQLSFDAIFQKAIVHDEEACFTLFKHLTESINQLLIAEYNVERVSHAAVKLFQSTRKSPIYKDLDKILFKNLIVNSTKWTLMTIKSRSRFAMFYSIVLLGIADIQSEDLQRLDETILVETILNIISVEGKNGYLADLVKESCFLHKNLLKTAIEWSNTSCGAVVLSSALKILQENDYLTEDLIDYCLSLATPNYSHQSSVITFCVVVSYITDISCARANVEKYVDAWESDVEVKNNIPYFSSLIQLVESSLSRWYELSATEEGPFDYVPTILTVLDNLLVWKDDHSEQLLFSCSIEEDQMGIVEFNKNLISMLKFITRTCARCFRNEHWDFLLCSMISWLQTCKESIDAMEEKTPTVALFISEAIDLYSYVATILTALSVGKSSLADDMQPSVSLQKTIVIPNISATTDLLTEWQEFFTPAASKCLFSIYESVTSSVTINDEPGSFTKSLCAAIRYIPDMCVRDCLYKDEGSDKRKKISLELFCNRLCRHMKSSPWYIKIASFQLQERLAVDIEELLCSNIAHDEDNDEASRSFPPAIIKIMESTRNETLVILSNEQASINTPLENLQNFQEKTSLLTYLLSWQLILQIFKMAAADQRAKFANFLHQQNYINELITCLFCILPSWRTSTNDYNTAVTTFDYASIQNIAFHLLTTSMQNVPAMIRFWFNNNINRKDVIFVDRLVSSHFSPILLRNEFKKLEESSKEFDNMVVKTRPVAREVAAIYTVDEISMELVVKLSINHPLSPVSVECGKRIGVSNQLWRQWMLQLNTFLSFQNGSILDGLALWKKNVDKRFEGVEECMVCFSVIHGSNYSLPTIACKTCKKKFHPACLYTWFNKSGKSTCPLCRNIF